MQIQNQNNPIVYLGIINLKNEPILFQYFAQKPPKDELNFQIHFYAALDLFEDKILQKKSQYLGFINSIYSIDGQFDIYGYYTVTKVKIMMILKQKSNLHEKYEDGFIANIFKQIYSLYKNDIFNPFNTTIRQNKLSIRFYEQLKYYMDQIKFK